jgi:hypothetical protein
MPGFGVHFGQGFVLPINSPCFLSQHNSQTVFSLAFCLFFQALGIFRFRQFLQGWHGFRISRDQLGKLWDAFEGERAEEATE